ncbi:uncharacterized protein LOC123432463 [Hordeum vulgare subsp. vulgare]|uniref:PR17d n=1 Tax=Hordeum vulgare subsp. vulgare TaxID=112509 RepID=A7YA66_HORVV|nr:uncharacterized protein LOC123432463 [Hordeum vulgare subsp. vulgare]ABV22584.1 PR17d precursor [Hordeum vulgare subsp. vulgare]ABV22585.1 PR17d precursor [Hordeum vulgare subsp. vulgare]KAI5016690.1 hypothetical protein ZWY2020_006541 [Hordeum vulgare]BAK03040.1 predicted protein [Hordeum vulgare subsp. vulgare]
MKIAIAAAAAAPLLLLLALAGTARAVTFDATNTVPDSAGGQRFNQDVGVDYAKQVLSDASSFIWTTFNQPNPGDRRDYDSVTLAVVDNIEPVAQTVGNAIQLRAQYVAGFDGDVKQEVKGVLYHEATHVWQWIDHYGEKPGLFEGIADYVRLKADLAPGHWVKDGGGDRWDQGYDVTARFLDYCDSLKPGFVAEMNGKLKDGYSDDYFVQILGKSVDELWSDYKAKYPQPQS